MPLGSYPGIRPYNGPPATGFTLLEVLVAVAIFILIAMMAYGGLNSVIRQSEIVDQQAERLLVLQRGLAQLRSDLQQSLDRPVRDARGTMTAAFIGANPGQSGDLFALTRLGHDNPWFAPQGQLARIRWRLAGETLQRYAAAPIDGAAEPDDRDWESMIEDVTAMELRYYDQENDAHPLWPPVNHSDAGLPQAVEIMLYSHQMPPIRITAALVDNWPTNPPGFDPDAENGGAGAAGIEKSAKATTP
ncbi:MAG TPA: type II secretion system minor pseudopilin GspJ [Guyparkeria sp.]|nr:type II secretion system minor pseudopilin GspJ [Guyparkeria sp.]